MTLYEIMEDRGGRKIDLRDGLRAHLVQRVLNLGLETSDTSLMGFSAMVTFDLIFLCWSVSVAHVGAHDLEACVYGVNANLTHRKAKKTIHQIILTYPESTSRKFRTDRDALLVGCMSDRPLSVGFSNFHVHREVQFGWGAASSTGCSADKSVWWDIL